MKTQTTFPFLWTCLASMVLASCHLEKTDNDSFTPSFNIVNNGCGAPCEVVLQNTTEGASDQEWHFSDTSLVLVGDPETRRYQFPGEYDVTLYVWNSRNTLDTLTKRVNITTTTFEAFSPAYEPGKKAVQLNDGSYAIVGTKVGQGSLTDVYFVRANVTLSGEITSTLSSTTFDIGAYDEVNDMVLLSDGTLAIVGTSSGPGASYRDSVFYIRTNTSGAKINGPKKLAFSSTNNRGLAIAEAPDGSVLITGQSSNGTNSDMFLAKYKSDLTVKYFVNPVIALPDFESGVAVVPADDGGYFVVGTTALDNSSQTDVLLVKLNANGSLASDFPKKFIHTDYDNVSGIVRTLDGSLVIAGTSNLGNGDVYLIATNQNGSLKSGYPLTLGDPTLPEEGFALVSSGNNYVVVGYKDTNAMLWKLGPSGTLLKSKSFGAVGFDYFKSAGPTVDGGFIMTGGKNDVLYLVKAEKDF